VAPVAADHQNRVQSLILLMPGSGNPAIKIPAQPERLATLPPMPASTAVREAVFNYRVALSLALEGSKFRRGEDQIRNEAQAATRRSWNPDALARTGAATLAAGDLRPTFARVRAPTVVLHGSDDPLLSPEHGRAIASAIPNAKFELVEGLGHSLPEGAVPHVLKAVVQVLPPSRKKAKP
jgi:pimeloyl-ACP methyl ester carboxylesterase